MKKWKILYTEKARIDLRGIHDYIAYSLLVPETARKQAERIANQIEALAQMPLAHPLYENEPLRARGLRKFIVDNFIVFYLPVEVKLEIAVISIMYSGRNLEEWLSPK